MGLATRMDGGRGGLEGLCSSVVLSTLEMRAFSFSTLCSPASLQSYAYLKRDKHSHTLRSAPRRLHFCAQTDQLYEGEKRNGLAPHGVALA